MSNYSDIGEEHLCQNHHVIKAARILSTEKHPVGKYIRSLFQILLKISKDCLLVTTFINY